MSHQQIVIEENRREAEIESEWDGDAFKGARDKRQFVREARKGAGGWETIIHRDDEEEGGGSVRNLWIKRR